MTTTTTQRRRRANKRGSGAKLREEIVDAATLLLSTFGSREAVTLRAIAREAGIAAPSIYPHFPDRNAILDVVVSRTFTELEAACARAADGVAQGPARVEALGLAYVDFARTHPGQYHVLFERSPSNVTSLVHPYEEGLQAFDLLVRALGHPSADHPTQEDPPVLNAQSLFAALHGIASLPPALPGFPWQDQHVLVRNVVSKLSGW